MYRTTSPAFSILLLFVSPACAQHVGDSTRVTDSAGIDPTSAPRVIDPAGHRLFTMSTGKTMRKGTIAFGIHEFLFVQGGYAPTDFLQLNLTLVPVGAPIMAFGAKVQLVPPSGFFHGLAINADVGHALVRSPGTFGNEWFASYNIATSFGAEMIEGHVSAGSMTTPGFEDEPFPTLIQVGTSIDLDDDGSPKLMAEAWLFPWIGNEFEIRAQTIFFGMRAINNRFVWELGGFLLPDVNLSGHGRGTTFILPYVSGAWYF